MGWFKVTKVKEQIGANEIRFQRKGRMRNSIIRIAEIRFFFWKIIQREGFQERRKGDALLRAFVI